VLLTFDGAGDRGRDGVIWGNDSTSIRSSYVDWSFHLGSIFLPKAQVYGGAGVVVLCALWLILTRLLGQGSGRRPPLVGAAGRDQVTSVAAWFGLGLAAAMPAAPSPACSTRSCRVALPWIARLLAIVVLGGLGSIRVPWSALVFHRRTVTAVYISPAGDRRAVRDRVRRPADPTPGAARQPPARRRGDHMSSAVARVVGFLVAIGNTLARLLSRIHPIWFGRGIAAVAGLLLLAYPVLSDNLYYQNMIIFSLVFAIAASGLSIITGLAGYVSLGRALIGLGGYTVGVLATAPRHQVALDAARRRRGRSGRADPRPRRAARARTVVRDHHRRVPLPRAGDRDQLALAHRRHRGAQPADPHMERRLPELALLLRPGRDPRGAAAPDLVDPAYQTGTGSPSGDETKAATIGINLPVEKIIASSRARSWSASRAGSRLLPDLHRPARHVQHPAQRRAAGAPGRRQGHPGAVLGAFIVEPLNQYANNNLGGGSTRLLPSAAC
jgi:hypothetical protein